MLCLKITSPGNLILKLIVVLLQYLDRLCVSNTGEIRIRNIIQSLQKSFINERIKEIHLFRRVFKNIIDDIFQHRLCQIHVVFKICKRNLRFDHPKLCRMTGCVWILRAECRAECINTSKRLRICLSVQLTAYRKARLFSEEIFCIIYCTILILRDLIHIKSRNTKHLARAFTVASCYKWCVHINKSLLLEELMNRIRCQRTHTEYSLKCIRSRTQMRNRSQILKRMTFLLQRIIRSRRSLDLHFIRLNLKRLFCLRSSDKRSFHNNRSSDVQFRNFRKVLHLIMIYNLKRLKIRTVIYYNETKCLWISETANPASYRYFFAKIWFSVFK